MSKIREKIQEEIAYLNRGDLDGVCRCYTDDVVFEDVSDPDHPAIGMAAFRESMKGFFDGFSDLNVDVQRFLCTEDENGCAVEYILSGTHDGEFAGLKPTGKKMTAYACSVYELKENLLNKERIYWDMGQILGQLK